MCVLTENPYICISYASSVIPILVVCMFVRCFYTCEQCLYIADYSFPCEYGVYVRDVWSGGGGAAKNPKPAIKYFI